MLVFISFSLSVRVVIVHTLHTRKQAWRVKGLSRAGYWDVLAPCERLKAIVIQPAFRELVV